VDRGDAVEHQRDELGLDLGCPRWHRANLEGEVCCFASYLHAIWRILQRWASCPRRVGILLCSDSGCLNPTWSMTDS
jgi:hypothetical protein